MSVYSQQLAPVPSNTDAARIAQLEGQVKALLNTSSNSQVGDYVYTSIVPANWNTPGTLIVVQGNRMVPNGVNLSRTDFPILNAAYSAMGYPYGTGDGSTTFGTKDILGRAVVCVGTNAAADLNDDDGLALASRNPKPTVSVSGTTGTGTTGSPSHSASSYFPGDGSGTFGDSAHTHSVPSLSVSASGTVTPGYAVAGIWLLIVG